MHILGLDFETQSLDAKTTNVTEVGAALYRYEGGEFSPPICLSSLVWEPEYPPQTPEVVALTGLTDSLLQRDGLPKLTVFNQLLEFIVPAELIIAHNAKFDRTVFESTCEALNITPPKKEWLCTFSNFPWPKGTTCHRLGHLGFDHGLDFPAKSLHRAIDDVKLMMALVGCYNFEKVLDYARTPWAYLRADVNGPWIDGGVQSGIAKGLGFAWEQVRGDDKKWPKTWVARIKRDRVEEVRGSIASSKSPFRVSIIEGL